MKANIPPNPHTAETTVFRSQDGRHHVLVVIGFEVPSRVAAMLPEETNGFHFIPAAGIYDESHVAGRARHWSRPVDVGDGRKLPPGAQSLRAATDEGCDTRIQIAITPHQWHLVGMLCGKLGITPAQWFIAGAFHNARVEEEAMDRHLANVTA